MAVIRFWRSRKRERQEGGITAVAGIFLGAPLIAGSYEYLAVKAARSFLRESDCSRGMEWYG